MVRMFTMAFSFSQSKNHSATRMSRQSALLYSTLTTLQHTTLIIEKLCLLSFPLYFIVNLLVIGNIRIEFPVRRNSHCPVELISHRLGEHLLDRNFIPLAPCHSDSRIHVIQLQQQTKDKKIRFKAEKGKCITRYREKHLGTHLGCS